MLLDPDLALNTRRLNRQRLLGVVLRQGPISRADLAKRTPLSPPTVSALVDELVNEVGLLREVGVGVSSGGRPPVMLAFNAEFGFLIGVDIGSRKLRVGLTDLQGRVLAQHAEPTDTASQKRTIDQIHRGIDRVFDAAGRDRRKLFTIGVAAPGMTDVTHGLVISAVNLPGWVNVPLGEILASRYGVPVHVDNDANLAALGERWRGTAAGVDNFVFLALGAGVGAGVVTGGRLQHGQHWYAGEIARINLDWRDWHVDFGGRGYLENKVSTAAIPTWARARSLACLTGRNGGDAVAAIFDAARAGDTGARAVVDELAVYIGAAVANIVAVLDPALVVFGGGLSHGGPLLLEPVQRVVERIVPNVPALRISALGDDAQLLGSVFSAMEAAETRLFKVAGGPPRTASRTRRRRPGARRAAHAVRS
jgi:predicted NBD/HSP70 family sugar kinase